MTTPHTGASPSLGEKAESLLDDLLRRIGDAGPGDVRHLLHQLATRQAELERHNETLAATQLQLRQSLVKYSQLFDFAPVGFLTLDRHGLLLDLNLEAARLLGEDRSRLRGQSLTSYVALADHAAFFSHLSRAFVSGAPHSVLLMVQGRTAGERQVELRTVCMDLAPGESLRCLCSLVDITDRIRAEQLRCEVERMTRHDLKVPLNALVNLPDMIREAGPVDSEQGELLDMAKSAAHTMLGMINIFLDLSRIEAGTYRLEPGEVDILGLAGRIVQEFRQRGMDRRSALRITLDGREPAPSERLTVAGEELLLYAMLGNLLQNAVEASPRDGVVEIDLARAGNRTRVAIRNQGEVPQPVRARFFEKYVTHGKKSGTGLGTYSALCIARVHRGDIILDTSTPGATTVTVFLP